MEIDPLTLLAHWLHILSAALAVGVPIYVRLVLMPAMEKLDDENRSRLREFLAARWRIIVYLLIVIFLATGLYNFLVVARWREWKTSDPPAPEKVFQYHLIFGIKFLLAFVMFFLSSALAGRSAALAYFRNNAKVWTTFLISLGIVVVGLSGILRFM